MRAFFASAARRAALPGLGLVGAGLWLAQESDRPAPPRFDFVLAGGGVASFMAARELREQRPDATILVVGDEGHPAYLRPPLSKSLWRATDEQREALLFPASDGEAMSVWAGGSKEASSSGASQTVAGRVRAVHGAARVVELESGEEYAYGKLLLATGARAVGLQHVQETVAERVMTLRTLDDWKKLYGLTRGRPASEKGPVAVTVVGGGYLGTELAAALAEYGGNCRVVQLLNNEVPMDAVFPHYLGQQIARRLAEKGVETVANAHAVGVVETESGRCGVVLEDGTTRESDLVVLALGAASDYGLIARSGLEVDDRLGGVVANSELQVATDIWAAGDVVSYYDTNIGVRRRMMHADHASMSGIHAAQNMLGAGKAYEYMPIEFGAIGDMEWEGCGLLDSRLDTVSVWDKETKGEYERGVVYYTEEGNVVGVLCVGVSGRMDYAKKLVKFGFPIENPEDAFQLIYLGEK